jgi:hypothetical protein
MLQSVITVNDNLSLVGDLHARQHFNEGALAGSIFTNNAMNGARSDCEINIVKDHYPRKRFDYALSFKQRHDQVRFRFLSENWRTMAGAMVRSSSLRDRCNPSPFPA